MTKGPIQQEEMRIQGTTMLNKMSQNDKSCMISHMSGSKNVGVYVGYV